MREIKFRAWDGKKMCRIEQWDFRNPSGVDIRGSDGKGTYTEIKIPIMQYTGLTDKNGKEIYEGDILEWRGKYLEVIWGSVGWNLTSQIFKYPHQSWNDRPSCGEVNTYGYVVVSEVIGNIYENPNLVKE